MTEEKQEELSGKLDLSNCNYHDLMAEAVLTKKEEKQIFANLFKRYYFTVG